MLIYLSRSLSVSGSALSCTFLNGLLTMVGLSRLIMWYCIWSPHTCTCVFYVGWNETWVLGSRTSLKMRVVGDKRSAVTDNSTMWLTVCSKKHTHTWCSHSSMCVSGWEGKYTKLVGTELNVHTRAGRCVYHIRKVINHVLMHFTDRDIVGDLCEVFLWIFNSLITKVWPHGGVDRNRAISGATG